MALTVTPYIPTYITVHLGTPESAAENVTVSFTDYIKNVASSEIYPTWHNSALRANILAQISFALNRIYTEFYPSKGYSFNITSTTAYDQRYIKGRNIFDNIDTLVDDIFNVYIRRQGFIEPLAAGFCNGTTSKCGGLSQWGSEYLAQQGYNSVEILKYYYGDNIELVDNAPLQDIRYSYPGHAMRVGDRGPEIRVAQFMLNQISMSYPAIPKIFPVDGVFTVETEDAMKKFQSIFNLTVDGIIGKSTWYMLVQLYSGVLELSELISDGQIYFQNNFAYKNPIVYGEQGERVYLLQYLLSVLSQFYFDIPFLNIDGVFGDKTLHAVKALQREIRLPETGTVDEITWSVIVTRFSGIDRTVLTNPNFFPGVNLGISPLELQDALIAHPDQFPGFTLEYGQNDQEGGTP